MIENAACNIVPGMSGSPIVAENGTAMGIGCLGNLDDEHPKNEGGPNPRLMGNLPGWFLKTLSAHADRQPGSSSK